jgi:uncharacterized DUF497 family protein
VCILLYTGVVAVVWDPAKSVSNFSKHDIRLADAVPVLDDPLAITITDDESDAVEQRSVTLGMDSQGRILVVGLHLAW